MAQKLTQSGLKKWLKTKDQQEMTDLIVDLYKTDPQIKERLSILVLGDEYARTMVEKSKNKLDKIFYSHSFTLAKAEQVMKDFKIECPDDRWVGELSLYFVQLAMQWDYQYGIRSDKMYRMIEKAFEDVAKAADKDQQVYEQWKKDLEEIIDLSYDLDIINLLYDDYLSIQWVSEEMAEEEEE